jgi:hypothetical protein
LERLKTTYKGNEGLLLPAVQRHVMRRAAGGEDDLERRQDIMHPSEMSKTEWCPKADYYRIRDGVSQGAANPSFMMENVFDEGHRIHRKWQGWLWDMGLLSGMFGCKECDNTWWDTSPESCPECMGVRLRYREVPLLNDELMIAGHSDGLVFDGGDWLDLGEPVLIEIKSLSIGTLRFEAPLLHQRYLDGLGLDEVWRDVKRPFASHIKQGTIYCWLGGFSRIVFIYECKWNQQAKEFVVTPNFDHIKGILNSAKDVADALRHDMEPYRPPWAESADGPICRSCPHRITCWSIDDTVEAPPEEAAPVVVRATAARRRKALRTTAV